MSIGRTAREEMLRRIRAALHDVPDDEQPEAVVVARDYRRSETVPHEEVVERFVCRSASTDPDRRESLCWGPATSSVGA